MSEIELHRKLLGDAVRNEALAEALHRTIKPGCSVADLGAGTGFLSFLARKLGAGHCHLYEYSGALALAREIAQRNGITGLTFVEAHSTQVARPPKADVVISETLGNFALEEGLLETLADAKRFLKPGGTLLPCGLSQFVAPVTSKRLQDEIDIWPHVGHALDFSAARELSLNNMYVRTVKPADLPGKAAARLWDEIDFSPKAGVKLSSVRSGRVQWSAGELGGAVHGFALWWTAQLVPGVAITTSPFEAATHWEQVYLPLLEAASVEGSEVLELELGSDTRRGVDVSWNTSVRNGRVKRAGKALKAQRQELSRGRL